MGILRLLESSHLMLYYRHLLQRPRGVGEPLVEVSLANLLRLPRVLQRLFNASLLEIDPTQLVESLKELGLVVVSIGYQRVIVVVVYWQLMVVGNGPLFEDGKGSLKEAFGFVEFVGEVDGLDVCELMDVVDQQDMVGSQRLINQSFIKERR